MAIDLFWDDEKQSVLLAEFNGKWTWDELHKLISKIKQMSDEREMIFGAIIDLRNGMHLPGGNIFNRETLNQFKALLSLGGEDDKKGPVVVLGVNTAIKMIFDAIKNLDKTIVEDVEFAATEDEARQFIYAAVAKFNDPKSA
ncbi:MAG: hypothetical protein WBC91_12180 [Phototrophicaceae bacterium]